MFEAPCLYFIPLSLFFLYPPPLRWRAHFKVQESQGFLPQTEGGGRALQQSVRYHQQHLGAAGDSAANRHHHPPGAQPPDC